MSTTKQNPNDIFWLARYAHNQLAPALESLSLTETTMEVEIGVRSIGERPGVNVWIHYKNTEHGVLDYKLNAARHDIDMMVAGLPAKYAQLHNPMVAA